MRRLPLEASQGVRPLRAQRIPRSSREKVGPSVWAGKQGNMTKKKTTKAIARKAPDLNEVITTTLRAVRLQYAGDPSGAGLVLAELPSGEFYASVCRYRAAYGGSKEVVARGRGADAEAAIRAAASQWRNRPQDAASALAALDRMLGAE